MPSGAEGTSPARVPREMGDVIDLTCCEAQTGWFSEQKASGKTCGNPQAEAGTAASREAGVELGREPP